MTRINLINPEELTDQHLIAEYREITMVPAALKRTINSKSGFNLEQIPKKFTLNKGHVKFFYDKGLYLNKRYHKLVKEMKKRGFQPNEKRTFPKEAFSTNLYNDWTPTLEDEKIIKERIAQKIKMKPQWYKKNGRLIKH